MNPTENSKKSAGYAAAGYVQSGMVVGLGTGSTVKYALEMIAKRIKNEGLDILGIPTSEATAGLAMKLGIPLSTLDEHPVLDMAIDGADEVDPDFNLIKGGGGAHTREKIVATASKRFIVVVDKGKVVGKLGDFGIPIEVLPFGAGLVKRKIEGLGGTVKQRSNTSDNGNMLMDARMEICNPAELEDILNSIPGVIENGIFAHRRADVVIVGDGAGVVVIEREDGK